MEFTGKLKEQVEKAESAEEAKKVVEDAGMIISDDELDEASGGILEKRWIPKVTKDPKRIYLA